MKYSLIAALALVCVNVLADAASLEDRITNAQNLLLAEGPSINVLNEYETLIHDIEISDAISDSRLAQVYFKKALVASGTNRDGVAAQDFLRVIKLDPGFTPAADKLVAMWLRKGQFSDIRTHFTKEKFPEAFRRMQNWEGVYASIDKSLDTEPDLDKPTIDKLSTSIQEELIAVTHESAAAYELSIKLAKYQAARGKDISFDDLAKNYIKIIRLSGHRDTAKYAVLSQVLLFTQGKFQDAWNAVKNCLRIDNDVASCGRLSKIYSKMQTLLKAYEEYFVMDEYFYGGTEAVVSEEKLAVKFSPSLYEELMSPVKMSKKEMASLPSSVTTNLDFLRHLASNFCETELPGISPDSLPFIKVLNKFVCELSIEAKSPDRKAHCASVGEKNQPFLPKHLAKLDSLISKRKYDEAKQILGKFSENVKKTDKFQKRMRVIQDHEEKLQRQRQQQYRQQQQQRQEQFRQQQHEQQQQQSHFDRKKDYYKILDVSKDADEKSIKKAYRAQTLKYHPDKYKGNDLDEKAIEAKMQEINEAYEVLSNPSSKADYDRGGAEQPRRGGHSFHQQAGGQNVQFNMNDFMRQFMQNSF